jgi:hypothetical protein
VLLGYRRDKACLVLSIKKEFDIWYLEFGIVWDLGFGNWSPTSWGWYLVFFGIGI